MPTPRTLDVVLAEYKRADETAKRDLDLVPMSTRPAHEAAIRKAKADLPTLRLEYLTLISKQAYGFFVEGDSAKSQKFAEIAAENGAFSINAATIFDELADAVQPSLGGRKEFSVTQVSLLDYALRTLVEKTGYEGSLNRITINDVRVVSNREQLVSYVRELVTRTNGATPSAVYAQAEIIRLALASGFNKKKLVVTVRNATATDRAALHGIFSRTVKVDVDAPPAVDERFAKDTIMRALYPDYKPEPLPQKQPEPIVPATNPTTTEPKQENQP